jgi:hypothetical protein
MWVASATAYLLGNSIPQLISKGLLPFKQGPFHTHTHTHTHTYIQPNVSRKMHCFFLVL